MLSHFNIVLKINPIEKKKSTEETKRVKERESESYFCWTLCLLRNNYHLNWPPHKDLPSILCGSTILGYRWMHVHFRKRKKIKERKSIACEAKKKDKNVVIITRLETTRHWYGWNLWWMGGKSSAKSSKLMSLVFEKFVKACCVCGVIAKSFRRIFDDFSQLCDCGAKTVRQLGVKMAKSKWCLPKEKESGRELSFCCMNNRLCNFSL